MKKGITMAILSLVTFAGAAYSQPAPLDYAAIKAEAKRIEKLEGSEYVISSQIQHKTVRLNLKPFGKGADTLFVVKADEVAFVCATGLPKNFKGGWVTGRIEQHEPGPDIGHFYDLSNCKAE